MTQHQINEMRARRYSALSLPLRESMLMAQQNREDATQADELATPPQESTGTGTGCRGAWHE